MSFCKKEGKDKIIFVTEEDHTTPSKVSLPEEDEEDTPAGLVLPSGEINWGCPCLGGMATGPCGVEFREAFTCFHNSKADPKGSDCLDPFRVMSECMSHFPGVYGTKDDDDDDDEDDAAVDAIVRESLDIDSKNTTEDRSSFDKSSNTEVQPHRSNLNELSKT